MRLALDVWNPCLSDAEKDLANGLLSGLREYRDPSG